MAKTPYTGVGFRDATSTESGLVKKNKFQIKRLTTNIGVTGVLTDLSYALEAGKTYRITLNMVAIGTNRNVILFKDGSIVINKLDAAGGTAATASVIRTMGNTDLTFDVTSLASNLEGDVTQREQTHAIVEELENYDSTIEW